MHSEVTQNHNKDDGGNSLEGLAGPPIDRRLDRKEGLDPSETLSGQAGTDTTEMPHVGPDVQEFKIDQYNSHEVIGQLEKLHDKLQGGTILKNLECHYTVTTESLSLALQAAPLINDIHKALKNHPNSFIKVNHPKEIHIGGDSDLDSKAELKSILSYLKDPSTPRGIKPNIVIRAESAQAVSQTATLLNTINTVLKDYEGSSIKLKAVSGTPESVRVEMARQYRLAINYRQSQYIMKSETLNEDLRNVHTLVRAAHSHPDKAIQVKLPDDLSMPAADTNLLRENFYALQSYYGDALDTRGAKRIFTTPGSPYRSQFVLKENLIQVGNRTLTPQEERQLIKQLRKMRTALSDKADALGLGAQPDPTQWMLRVKKGAPLSRQVLKEIALVLDEDQYYQRKFRSFGVDELLLESERRLPGLKEIALRNAVSTTQKAISGFISEKVRQLTSIRPRWLTGLRTRTRIIRGRYRPEYADEDRERSARAARRVAV